MNSKHNPGIRELIAGAGTIEEIKDLRQEAMFFEQLSYKTARAIHRTAQRRTAFLNGTDTTRFQQEVRAQQEATK